MSRSRIWIGLVIIVVLSALGYAGYDRYLAPAPPTPTSTPGASGVEAGPEVVTAEGRIIPARDARLAFRFAGRVVEILAEEGEAVAAGDVLIKLEDADLRAAVAQAEAAVAQAEAGVALAQARLDQITEGARPEEIAAAEAQVKAANSAVGQAVAQRNQAAKGPTPDTLAAAEAQLAQALALQKEAQIAYDRIIENIQFLAGATEEQARFKLNAANEGVVAAQAAVSQIKSGASPETVQAYNSAIGVAANQRAAAEAQLELLRAGATLAQVTAARAQVDQAKAGLQAAQAALEAAQAQLAQTVLTAPFAGTVVNLNVDVGEVVAPGAPVVVLADLSTWRMRTSDLSETDVVLVRPGQTARVTLDALAEQTFDGTVAEIASVSETTRGNTTYAVTIRLSPTEAPLRWGMTAFVDIAVGP